MQIPILNGVFTDSGPDVRTSYPINLVPVPIESGISSGLLRPGDGIVENGTGPGTDRGGVYWKNKLYRVMGTKLVEVSNTGAVTILGEVGGPSDTYVTFDYSFDLLAIASGTRLYYWNPVSLTLDQVTDPDLGIVIDVVWIDGYFMTTDGTSLVVTELINPMLVDPFKYGSAESDPDPVVALLKLRNEVYALNRNTIEVFENSGGIAFPFERIESAQIQRGTVGTFACCVYMDQIAFLGSGRNEAPALYMGVNSQSVKFSTREIEKILLGYTEAELALVKLEARNDLSHNHLYVHLPDRTIVFDGAASKALDKLVWFTLTSTDYEFKKYRARNFVWAYEKWLVGDPQSNKIGYVVDTIGAHWGETVRWEFGTQIVYNESKGAIFNEIELVSLTGRVEVGTDPKISTSYSVDGLSFSQEKFISAGTSGDTKKRLTWFRQGSMRNFRTQKFRGDSDAHISFVRLEATIEPLAY